MLDAPSTTPAEPPAPPPHPPRPPRVWPIFVSLAIMFLVSVGAVVVAALVIGIRYAQEHGAPADEATAQQLLNEFIQTPAVMLVSLLISSGVTAGCALLGAAWSEHAAQQRLRVGLRLAFGHPLPVAAGTALCAMGFSILFGTVSQHLFGGPPEPMKMMSSAVSSAEEMLFVLLAIEMAVLAPLAEELFFRGYAQTRLVDRWGPTAGILVSSVLFGLVHWDWLHSSFAFGLGLVLGVITWRARSMVPALVGHVANNALAVMGSLAPRTEGATDVPGWPAVAFGSGLLLCGVVLLWPLWRPRGSRP